jgi:hypothetical protein
LLSSSLSSFSSTNFANSSLPPFACSNTSHIPPSNSFGGLSKKEKDSWWTLEFFSFCPHSHLSPKKNFQPHFFNFTTECHLLPVCVWFCRSVVPVSLVVQGIRWQNREKEQERKWKG